VLCTFKIVWRVVTKNWWHKKAIWTIMRGGVVVDLEIFHSLGSSWTMQQVNLGRWCGNHSLNTQSKTKHNLKTYGLSLNFAPNSPHHSSFIPTLQPSLNPIARVPLMFFYLQPFAFWIRELLHYIKTTNNFTPSHVIFKFLWWSLSRKNQEHPTTFYHHFI